jgi:hypothetical protein
VTLRRRIKTHIIWSTKLPRNTYAQFSNDVLGEANAIDSPLEVMVHEMYEYSMAMEAGFFSNCK